jgi:hypothetical protein
LILSHWVLALLIFFSLALGWSSQCMPMHINQTQSILLNVPRHAAFLLRQFHSYRYYCRSSIIADHRQTATPSQRISQMAENIRLHVIYFNLRYCRIDACQRIFPSHFQGTPLPRWARSTSRWPSLAAHRVTGFAFGGYIVKTRFVIPSTQ